MVKEILVSDLKSKLEKKENILLLDVREQNEWDEERIDGAKLVPKSQFQEKLESLLPYKDKEIIVQCKSGGRSMDVATNLISNGFKNVANLKGGILAWKSNGYPTEKG
jgi:rhodanese-related sulfurtransferase